MCGGDGTHLTTCRVSWNSRDAHDTYAVSATLCASAYLSSAHFSPIPGDTESNQLKAFIKVMDMVCVHGSAGDDKQPWMPLHTSMAASSHTSLYQRPGGLEGRNQVICQISSIDGIRPERREWTEPLWPSPRDARQRPRKFHPKTFPLTGFVVRFNQRKAISLRILKATGDLIVNEFCR